MAIEIREATPNDAAVIAELLAHLGYPADAATIPARLAAISAAGGTILLAGAARGVAVGLIGLHAFPVLHASAPVAYITALVVAPSVQGQGVGRALVTAAEEWARAAGCSRLTVTSAEHRTGAHTFYPKLGLPYTGRRYSRPLVDPGSRPAP